MKKTIKTAPAAKTVKAPKAKPTKAPAAKNAPTKQKTAATTAASVTTISAKIDIGFGNHLTLRGEGPGLSWDQGLTMDCTNNTLWSAVLKGATAPVVFKFLVNDISWSIGKDYVVEPGQSVTVTPTF